MSYTLDRDIVIIDDNYIGQIKTNYEKTGETMDEVMEAYVRILRQLIEEGGISGKTAEKLGSFADLAETLLKEVMQNVTSPLAQQMEQYVEEIDEADKEIY